MFSHVLYVSLIEACVSTPLPASNISFSHVLYVSLIEADINTAHRTIISACFLTFYT